MIRFWKILFAIGVFAAVLLYVDDDQDENNKRFSLQPQMPEKEFTDKNIPDDGWMTISETAMEEWLHRPSARVKEIFGDPDRLDDTPYGYEWWIYHEDPENAVQFGVADDKVQTIFIMGENLSASGIHSGDDLDDLPASYSPEKSVEVQKDGSSYTFRLNEADMEERPLSKLNDDAFMQTYIDTKTEKVLASRLLDSDVLISHFPYRVQYMGDPPGHQEKQEQWEAIQAGMEQQIFDLTNMVRKKFDVGPLQWHESVHNAAYHHSKDMSANDYFAHVTPEGEGLKERMDEQGIRYTAAGENIAADYTDAPAAIAGWLNSEGHRKAMLEEMYTHLGVGVYRFYYTQNFITLP